VDCLFCKIVTREIPAEIVYEDEQVLAFNDINPVAPHHVLIIPKEHIPTLNDLTEAHNPLTGHMLLTAQLLAKQLNIAESGYRVVYNCNHGAGQAVYHIHLHLIGGRGLSRTLG
jgi:histidine triad (HIT) family protein